MAVGKLSWDPALPHCRDRCFADKLNELVEAVNLCVPSGVTLAGAYDAKEDFDEAFQDTTAPAGTAYVVEGHLMIATGYSETADKWVDAGTFSGPKGDKGETGAQGPAGPQGPQGPAGKDGTMSFEELTEEQRESLRGPQGETGPQGPAGTEGPQGEKGNPGPQGERGPAGPQGAEGPQGPAGPQGPEGPMGPVGPQGPQGPAGDAASGSVSITLLWANSNHTVNFDSQTVELEDIANYDVIAIEYAYNASSGPDLRTTQMAKYEVGQSIRLFTAAGDSSSSVAQSRDCEFTAAGISFGVCKRSGSTNNGGCIPIRIYGIKGVDWND